MEFKDEAQRAASEFLFGIVEARSMFQTDVVVAYALMGSTIEQVTDPHARALLTEQVVGLQTFCRRWMKMRDAMSREFQEKLVRSTLKHLKAHVSYLGR